MNNENTDYYWFYALAENVHENNSVITHRNVFEKGKGDYYSFVNMLTQ